MTKRHNDLDERTCKEGGEYQGSRHWQDARNVEEELSNNFQIFFMRRYSNLKIIDRSGWLGIICQSNYLVYWTNKLAIAVIYSVK